MGAVTNLSELISRLDEFADEDTIYASEPWGGHSNVVVAREPASGGLPSEAAKAGMIYFLEMSLARRFIEDWVASLSRAPSNCELCDRLIRYAIFDA